MKDEQRLAQSLPTNSHSEWVPGRSRRGRVWADVLQVLVGRDRSERQNIALRR
jgi:hypothetical protein